MIYFTMADNFGFTPEQVDKMKYKTLQFFTYLLYERGQESERKMKKNMRR